MLWYYTHTLRVTSPYWYLKKISDLKTTKKSIFAEISEICHFLKASKCMYELLNGSNILYTSSKIAKEYSKRILDDNMTFGSFYQKKTKGGGKKTAKNCYFCCLLGFCLIFETFYSLSGLARARIIFSGHSHSIKESSFQFLCPYEQMLKTPKLTPSEISVCLKSTNPKKILSNPL